MKQLAEEELLDRYEALSHPEVLLPGAVVIWKPGDEVPDMGGVSYRLRSRWKLPPVVTTCFTATAQAGRLFGGYGGRRSREKEQTHDIHFSAVYLRFRAEHPELTEYWISEADRLRERQSRREKLPDAILDLPDGPRIVEFGGAYSKPKLESFHGYWARREVPYEIW